MDIIPWDWSERHKKLNQIIRKTEYHDEAIELILDLHKDLHSNIVSGQNEDTWLFDRNCFIYR